MLSRHTMQHVLSKADVCLHTSQLQSCQVAIGPARDSVTCLAAAKFAEYTHVG